MSVAPTVRRLLLAGSVGPERLPPHPDPTQPRWFEPLHVRDPRGARERIASQVEAGADIVVAPTWQTHRRALLAVGGTRQARAWTADAVRIGREAIEAGLERRTASADAAPTDAEPPEEAPAHPALPRPVPLLAASLPTLDESPEAGAGRLLPRQAASERDYSDQAGLLADAEPDLLLVEGQATLTELRTAVDAALETGLPVWLAVSRTLLGAVRLGRVVDTLGDLPVACVLIAGPVPAERPTELDALVEWGGLLEGRARDEAEPWLQAGASVLGLLDGASPARLGPFRAAIDRLERSEREAAEAAEDAWWDRVGRAAAMTEGGAALWLGAVTDAAPAATRLPEGFRWTVATTDDVTVLPSEHFVLVVDAVADAGLLPRVRDWLRPGGVVVSPSSATGLAAAGLRILVIDEGLDAPVVIARKEP